MSIIIKGIDLPKEKDIVIKIKPNREVLKQLAFETVFVETEAEAIQIPTPHGRLIDGDKLYKDFENYCSGECDCCVHETENYNCGLIANAPTILEAEE